MQIILGIIAAIILIPVCLFALAWLIALDTRWTVRVFKRIPFDQKRKIEYADLMFENFRNHTGVNDLEHAYKVRETARYLKEIYSNKEWFKKSYIKEMTKVLDESITLFNKVIDWYESDETKEYDFHMYYPWYNLKGIELVRTMYNANEAYKEIDKRTGPNEKKLAVYPNKDVSKRYLVPLPDEYINGGRVW